MAKRTVIPVFPAPAKVVMYDGPEVVVIREEPLVKKMMGVLIPPRGSVATPW